MFYQIQFLPHLRRDFRSSISFNSLTFLSLPVSRVLSFNFQKEKKETFDERVQTIDSAITSNPLILSFDWNRTARDEATRGNERKNERSVSKREIPLLFSPTKRTVPGVFSPHVHVSLPSSLLCLFFHSCFHHWEHIKACSWNSLLENFPGSKRLQPGWFPRGWSPSGARRIGKIAIFGTRSERRKTTRDDNVKTRISRFC